MDLMATARIRGVALCRTLREVAEVRLVGARKGTSRTRSGDSYKPSALRGYEAALRTRIFLRDLLPSAWSWWPRSELWVTRNLPVEPSRL